MKLSVSSYSFSQYISNGKLTQLDCVKQAAEMGFDGIEFTKLEPYKDPSLEDQLLYADKIKNELNWMPQETFESGLRKTVCWYLEHKDDWCKHVLSGEYKMERLGKGE